MRRLLILLLFAVAVKAGPVTLQDPVPHVRLSDGRIVPYGPGVICTDLCVSVTSSADVQHRNLWIPAVFIATGVTVCAFLCRGGGGKYPAPRTGLVPPVSAPPIEVPEPAGLAVLGLAMLLTARRLRRSV